VIRSGKKTAVTSALVSKTPRLRHKRCPRCNQRLFVIDGEIEAHMEIPSAYGNPPQQCLPKKKAS
jgi:uncharacterized protein with PIN domain